MSQSITGNEGGIISQEVFDTLVKNYKELHGGDESYVKFSTIGKNIVNELFAEGVMAFRAYNGFDGDQTCTLLVPINKEGKELPVRIGGLKDPEGGKAGGSGQPKCPHSCG